MKTVILAAGFGSRLWPLSTESGPKQFQPLIGEKSLLQYSYDLFCKSVDPDELFILTLQGLEHHVYEQIPGFSSRNVVLVPDRSNTLPNALFAMNKVATSPDEPVLFSGVDIYFPEPQNHAEALSRFSKAITSGALNLLESIALFGVLAEVYDPSSGYVFTDGSMRVKGFLEKPSRAAIDKLVGNGPLYRSSFLFSATRGSFLSALKTVDPQVAERSRRLLKANESNRSSRFMDVPCVDLSSALLQKANNLVVQPIDGDFVDLGRYVNLFNLAPPDEMGNRTLGKVIVAGDCRDNLLINQHQNPLVVRHLKDSVVVQAKGGTLISPMSDVDAIGELYKANLVEFKPQ